MTRTKESTRVEHPVIQRVSRHIQKNRTHRVWNLGLIDYIRNLFGTPQRLFIPTEDLGPQPNGAREKKLNDGVYVLYEPDNRASPDMEVVFFHGLALHHYEHLYKEAWTSSSTQECWPSVWLPKLFPGARILSVSYDSCVTKTAVQGVFDLHNVTENIATNLIQLANVGQKNCPVVLIGHNLGGIIIKSLCVYVEGVLRSAGDRGYSEEYANFSKSMGGVFYFATPHQGLELRSSRAGSWKKVKHDGELVQYLEPLQKDLSRINDTFRQLRLQHGWRAFGVGPAHKNTEGLHDLEEASCRYDTDSFFMAEEDSESICKLQSESSSTFQFLVRFIESSRHGSTVTTLSLPFKQDSRYVPLSGTLQNLRSALQRDSQVVLLYGPPGSGKTCCLQYLALQYQQELRDSKSHVDECSLFLPRGGIFYVVCGPETSAEVVKDDILKQIGRNAQRGFCQLGKGFQTGDDQDDWNQNNGSRLSVRHNLLRDRYHLFCMKKALIILDGEPNVGLLQEMVQCSEGVKFLVASESSNGFGDCVCVKLDQLKEAEAELVLVKHASFEGEVIPDQLKDVTHNILVLTDRNPLAISTLAAAIHPDRRTSVAEWKDIERTYYKLLQADFFRAEMFGTRYRRRVDEAMTVAVDRLRQQSAMAEKLLYLISACGRRVDTYGLYLLAKFTLPATYEWETVSSCIRLLESKLLISRGDYEYPLFFKGVKQQYLESPGGVRTKFILDRGRNFLTEIVKKGDIKSRGGSADENDDAIFSTCLLAVFGEKQIAETALRALGSAFEFNPLRGFGGWLRPLFQWMYKYLAEEPYKEQPWFSLVRKVAVCYATQNVVDIDSIKQLITIYSSNFPSDDWRGIPAAESSIVQYIEDVCGIDLQYPERNPMVRLYECFVRGQGKQLIEAISATVKMIWSRGDRSIVLKVDPGDEGIPIKRAKGDLNLLRYGDLDDYGGPEKLIYEDLDDHSFDPDFEFRWTAWSDEKFPDRLPATCAVVVERSLETSSTKRNFHFKIFDGKYLGIEERENLLIHALRVQYLGVKRPLMFNRFGLQCLGVKCPLVLNRNNYNFAFWF